MSFTRVGPISNFADFDRIIHLFTKVSTPIKLSDLWFRHQSQNFYKTLKPISYEKVQVQSERSDEYMVTRKDTEQLYRDLLKKQAGIAHPTTLSFLYATAVGFHKMEHPSTYPGFTFYFRLTDQQIEKTIFEVVDKAHILTPKVGVAGLEDCLKFWNKHKNDMESYEDEVVNGIINPRVEVILGFAVNPIKFVNQIEDR